MSKVLILASVASMIEQFNMSNIKIMQELGHEVHVAANFINGNTSSEENIEQLKNDLKKLNVSYSHIPFSRKPIQIKSNIRAYKQIKRQIKRNNYKFIHCHSPIGGVCGRIAGQRTKTPVIYTAHGFHFFNGAPLLNWFLYYPIERFLSRYTNILVTINREDYQRAQKFSAEQVKRIPGVGVNIKEIDERKVSLLEMRKHLGISKNTFVILSVGELNPNKNHETIIKALSKLNRPNVCYLICGNGGLDSYLKKLASELGIENQVKLLGYRNDIIEISKIADVFAFPSKREGLGLAALEAMAAGLPLITSNVHGINDYSINGRTGISCKPESVEMFSEAIGLMMNDEEYRKKLSKYNHEKVKEFDITKVDKQMKEIYQGFS